MVAERVKAAVEAHVRGATGSGKRSLRSSSRTWKSGDVTSVEVGKTVKARSVWPGCSFLGVEDEAWSETTRRMKSRVHLHFPSRR